MGAYEAGMAKEARRRVKMATERQRTAAKLLAEGKPIKHALLEAGYTENVAKMGMAAVPDVVLQLLPHSSELMQIGKALTAADSKALILGRLAMNTIKGTDGGVSSAKVWGSAKELNLWANEGQVNQMVIQLPDLPEQK